MSYSYHNSFHQPSIVHALTIVRCPVSWEVFIIHTEMDVIDHFRVIPMDSQTMDITHFADVFNFDVTIKAPETLWSTIYYLWQ